MQRRKPVGRLRSLAVLAALGVSVLGAGIPASAANQGDQLPPGLVKQNLVEADDTVARGWDWTAGDDGVSSLGWNWAR